ncbi:hypothetical protein DV451_003292 [Geotrichum candidum]|uniref:Uncharacterized protein n=1 Tax=Geotrichum candidum TaxID=1173061 RepID=A0A9P5G4M4_GEOCN|nr:hypothetical protein DV451_003292 [Geotrichum candidum]
MPFFKKDIKLTESDAENIVTKTLAQLKSTLQKNDDDVFVTASGKGVITFGEIDKITRSLGDKIKNEKYVTLVDFGSFQRIDQTLLKRVVERLNTQTQNNSKTIILEEFVLSEPALESAKTQFYDTLNKYEEPVEISSVEIDDDLFKNEGIRAIIVKSIPKAVRSGQLQGKIEKGDTFVPEASIRRAQKNYANGLKANGIVAIEQLKKVGVKNLDEFLAEHVEEGTYIVLTENVILKSYVERIAAEVSATFKRDHFADVYNFTLVGVGQETPDRNAIIQLFLKRVYAEFPDTKFSMVFTKEVNKKDRKTTPPNYIVDAEFENNILEELKTEFVPTTAEAEVVKIVTPENYRDLIIYEDEGQLALPSTQILQLDERQVTAHLQKQQGAVLPLPLIRYYSSTELPELRQMFEKIILTGVQERYSTLKLSDLVLLLLHLTAVLDIEKTGADLAATIYKDFRKNTSYGYIVNTFDPALTLSNIKELVRAQIESAKSNIAGNFDLEAKLSARKQEIISHLGEVLKSTSDPATVFQVVVAVHHSRQTDGILDLTAKEAQKVYKLFKASWQLEKLDQFIKAIKEKRVEPELLEQVKEIAF